MAFATNQPIYEGQAIQSIKTIMSEGANMKTLLLRTMFDKSNINYGEIQKFLGTVNVFLKEWSEYAEELQTSMKRLNKVPLTAKVTTIEYDDVKEYLYAKYDYASILPFLDGLVEGVSSGKFYKTSDIADFFDFTTNKAFKDREANIGLMIADVVPSMSGPESELADAKEIALFNSSKSYSWYDRRDRIEIYKATEKAIDFLCKDYNFGKLLNEDRTTNPSGELNIAIINYGVEYICYTLAAYAIRIYMISRFAGPYIAASNYEMHESVEIKTGSISDMAINAMHEIDDADIRDISKFNNIVVAIGKALRACGCDTEGFVENPAEVEQSFCTIANSARKEKNEFCAKLSSNIIHNGLTSYGSAQWNIPWTGEANNIAEINQLMKSSIYNSQQAIGYSLSPKQEVMQVIRNLGPEHETLEGYQNLMEHLVRCVLTMMKQLQCIYNSSARLHNNNHPENNDRPYTITTHQELFDINKMAKELYIELAQAMIARARDIESIINQIKNANATAIAAQLEIKVPGVQTKKYDQFNDVNSAIPDTTRIPLMVMDIASRPHYEYLEMYDEYVKEIYGLSDDVYYTEGVGDSFNMIDTLLGGFLQTLRKFFTNVKFQAARTWVANHKNDLQNMTFSGKMDGIVPYRAKINLDTYIDPLGQKLKELPNKITSELLSSNQKVDELIKELYVNTDTYNLFHNSSNDAKATKEAYSNFILFGGDNAVIGKVEAPKLLNGVDVAAADFKKNYLNIWVNTVISTENVYKALNTAIDDFRRTIKDVKAKIVQITGEQAAAPTNSTTNQSNPNEQKPENKSSDNPPETPTQPKAEEVKKESVDIFFLEADTTPANPTTTPASSNEQKKDTNNTDKAANATTLLNGVRKACADLLINVYMPLTKAITDQYGYIKQVYTLGRK